ncbi:hypothetical protein LTR06_011165 [Exophiala xenobiotica]|nr:hypothetical protein LTR06_011165 [Exophiala xenobiotica]
MAVDGFGAAMCQMAAFALPELLQINGDILALSFLGLLFFYYPPAHPLGLPLLVALKEIDYIGMVLFVRGSLPVLMGIVWTSIYPASGKHVVVSLVVGALILFALWETLGWAKHLLTPPEVFRRRKGRDFTAPCITLAVINMFYYSSSIIWPTMIAACYTPGGEPWAKAAPLSTAQGLAITVGACSLSAFGSRIRYWQWQQTVSVTVVVVFGSLLALVTPDNMGMVMGFMIVSMLGYGWAIHLCIAFTQMGVPQEQLGISGNEIYTIINFI